MEASVRLLTNTAASLQRRNIPLSSLPFLNPNPRPFIKLSVTKCSLRLASPFPASPSPFSSSSSSLFSFSSSSHIFPSSTEPLSSNPSLNSFEGASTQWDLPNLSLSSAKPALFSDKGSVLTVVLLGWLGAQQKHLRKYAEMYNLRGVRSVRFVVPTKGLLGLDLGANVERKVKVFAQEIADWCSQNENDGRERHLMFHTFSNTGWLIYGEILDNFKSRKDLIGKIRGCIVDSGPCAEINTQVWAAGFCAALLKKRRSLEPPLESHDKSRMQSCFVRNCQNATRPSLGEMVLLLLLRNFFEVFLRVPDVNRRLKKYISVLSENQPQCPQLYLYSSADKVIPACHVEDFIAHQKALGRTVYAHDFVLSPHVDHFRSYPQLYASKIEEFLKLCITAVVS